MSRNTEMIFQMFFFVKYIAIFHLLKTVETHYLPVSSTNFNGVKHIHCNCVETGRNSRRWSSDDNWQQNGHQRHIRFPSGEWRSNRNQRISLFTHLTGKKCKGICVVRASRVHFIESITISISMTRASPFNSNSWSLVAPHTHRQCNQNYEIVARTQKNASKNVFQNCRRQSPSVMLFSLTNWFGKSTNKIDDICAAAAASLRDFSFHVFPLFVHTFGMGFYCHFTEPVSTATVDEVVVAKPLSSIFESDRIRFVLNNLHAPRPRLMLLSHFLVKCVPIDRHRCLWWAQKQWFKFIDISFCFVSFVHDFSFNFSLQCIEICSIELNLFVKQK